MPVFTGENALLEKVERHDRYQFEVKLDYPLDPDAEAQTYTVETYFFLSQSLNVSEAWYGPREFYRDVRDYVRFKTPQMTVEQIVAPNPLSPLARMEQCAARVRTGGFAAADLRLLVYEARMLGCILRATLRDLGRLVIDTHGRGTDRDAADALRLSAESLAPLASVLARYREVADVLLMPGFPPEVLSSLRLVDEYLSLTAEAYAMHLLDSLAEMAPDLRDRVARLAADEAAYRVRRGYRSVANPATQNEEFVYRNALLKKYVSSVQFLQIHRDDTRFTVEQTAFAIAAGLAMAFATAVSFLATRLAPVSWGLFTVLVVAYMMKDRMKEFGKLLISRWLGRSVPDHTIKITDPASGERIGRFRQKFMYLPAELVPDPVRRLRDAGRTEFLAERDFSEGVIRYTKALRLRPARVFGTHTRVSAVTDVLRMNVRQFLHSLDEARSTIEVLDPQTLRPHQLPAWRTYHLNVILRFWHGDDPSRATLRKLRVVLDQDGIQRVETFDPGPAAA